MLLDEPTVDQGHRFGHHPGDAKGYFVDQTPDQFWNFRELIDKAYRFHHLDTDLRIADLGGGNGIVADYLINLYNRSFKSLEIDVLDLDEEKFKDDLDRRIHFIKHDICLPRSEKIPSYDALVVRCALHYNLPKDQFRIIHNLYTYFGSHNRHSPTIIIQPAPSTEESQERINNLYQWLAEETGAIRKYWLRASQIKESLRKTRLFKGRLREVTHFGYPMTIHGFYSERYNLSKKQEKEFSKLLGDMAVCMPTHIFTNG